MSQLEIVADIETIPSQNPELIEEIRADLRANFKAPSDMTKERACKELGMTDEKEIKFTSKDRALELWVERFRDEKLEETAQDKLAKTSFDGALGQVAVIGFAIDDQPARVMKVWDLSRKSEIAMIENFFDALSELYAPALMRNPVFIGHNIAGFDLPFIFKRAVILGIKPPAFIPFGAAPWSDHIFDTMTRWDSRNNISLDKLCKALGIAGKTEGLCGADVWPLIKQGQIQAVADYCIDDVNATRNAYRRMTFKPLVEAESFVLETADALPF
jgi:predicted PolB exonuclease-like 3'-5' exonuclease